MLMMRMQQGDAVICLLQVVTPDAGVSAQAACSTIAAFQCMCHGFSVLGVYACWYVGSVKGVGWVHCKSLTNYHSY